MTRKVTPWFGANEDAREGNFDQVMAEKVSEWGAQMTNERTAETGWGRIKRESEDSTLRRE